MFLWFRIAKIHFFTELTNFQQKNIKNNISSFLFASLKAFYVSLQFNVGQL